MKGASPTVLAFYSAPCDVESAFAIRCWRNGPKALPQIDVPVQDTRFDNGTSDAVLKRGEVGLHPSADEPAVLRWTAPARTMGEGTISVRATFHDRDHGLNCMTIGDGVVWRVALNGVVLPGGRGALPNAEASADFKLERLPIKPGTSLDFSVDNGGEGNIFCDSTGLELRNTAR